MAPNLPKKMADRKFEKMNIKIEMSIYQPTFVPNFMSIWRTLDFGSKFPKKSMNEKNFGKINIKTVINI